MSEHSIPEQIQPVRFENEARYLLHDEREICRVLQSLIEKRILVSAYLAPRNRVLPTCLIGLSIENNLLSIDGSRDDATNASIEQSHHVTCVSLMDKIQIQFRLSDLVRTSIDGMAAFRAPIPDRLLRLQRRESHRLRVPVSEPLFCTQPGPPLPDGSEGPRIPLPVLDISADGACLQVTSRAEDFAPGKELQCQLHLPGAALLMVRLVVRGRFQSLAPNGTETWRAGCQFVALPQAAEAQIQRYIFRLERQRKARERGEA